APEPADDPERHRLKIRSLAGVLDGYRAAGAPCVVVSGVTDTTAGVDPALLPRAALTLFRLRTRPDELRDRLVRRGNSPDEVDSALREAGEIDRADFGDLCVDT